MAAFLVLAAVTLLVLPQVPRTSHLITAGEVPLLWVSAGALVVLAAAVAVWRSEGNVATAATIGSAAVLMTVAMYAGIGRAALDTYDLHPVARVLAATQEAGRPIAHHGKYHGQFQFIGRLERPLEVVQLPADLWLWAERHPEGSVVVYSYRPLEHASAVPQVMQKFKGRYVYVWRGVDLAGVSDSWTRGRADEGSGE